MRVITTVLLLSAASLAQAAGPRDLFPLDSGNQWTYKEAKTGDTLTISVMYTPVMHNGNVYYKTTGYTAEPAYLRQADNGNIYAWNEEFQRDTLVTSFEVVPHAWYDTEIAGCQQGGQAREETVRHRLNDGPYLTAVQIGYRSYTCADTGLNEELYAENIGLLRRVVSTFAGPRTYDLVYAKTSVATYDSQRGNTFTVSLEQNWLECATGADRLSVGLRLSRRQAPPIELRFHSSQRLDIRVRNDKGDVVYQWSDDVVSLPYTGTVLVDRDVFYSVQVPLRKRNGQMLDGGYHTLEAWLLTDNREFAGATRFFYSSCEPPGAPAVRR
jgi:hypothetical protein